MALNHTSIEALKPRARAYSASDDRGLSLAVQPSGAKWWRFRYNFEGKPKLLSLGVYPDVSLAQARERREQARKLVADGIDPSQKRQDDKALKQEKGFNSFEKISNQWFEHWQITHAIRHGNNVKSRLERNVYPVLGALPISEITTPQIVKCIKTIAARGANDIAKRCHQNIGQIFRFAIANGFAERNPASDVRPSDIIALKPAVNMARVDESELPDLMRAIDAYNGSNVTRLATKLMVLTFVRTGTLIGTPWSEIDFEVKLWRIPPSRMKMNNQHLVPLCSQSIDVLKTLKVLTGNTPLLFPSERGWQTGDENEPKSMSNNTILKALGRMGYKGKQTGHGFRGVASTILHEQGFDHQHIELQLAHKQRNAVAAAYNHALYLPQRTEMMQAWGNYLESLKAL
ncbi:MAG: integrase arm-type DNA-binding domain-containing protein [Methylotenera sp.]|nr:integrase arm-type DNA-binding domain-containing protein [Methylotenera sp.]